MKIEAIKNNGLDLRLIKPQRGDKYSKNLHRWLISEDNKHRAWAMQVYRDNDGILWIGMLDGRELIGSKLIAVLCNGAKETTAAWQNIDATEIPDFWARYVADGRCAIDPAHEMFFINDSARWNVLKDTRSCQWCGKHSQILKRWTEHVQREDWVNTI